MYVCLSDWHWPRNWDPGINRVGEGDINVHLLIFISPIHIYSVVLYIAQAGTVSPTLLTIFQPVWDKRFGHQILHFFTMFVPQSDQQIAMLSKGEENKVFVYILPLFSALSIWQNPSKFWQNDCQVTTFLFHFSLLSYAAVFSATWNAGMGTREIKDSFIFHPTS